MFEKGDFRSTAYRNTPKKGEFRSTHASKREKFTKFLPFCYLWNILKTNMFILGKEFISIIGNNDFSITNFKNCKTDAQKILFVFNMSYLGICRNLEALGEVVLNYFTSTFELFYDELLRYLVTTKNVQFSCLQGLLKLQGKDFIKAVVKKYS